MNVHNEWSWIDPQHIQFSRDDGGRLVAAWNGMSGPIKASRLFPITRGDFCIAVSDLDDNEWGVLRSTSGLEASSGAALMRELRISPYLPNIIRIVTLRRRFNHFLWEVDTDYGMITFTTGLIYESIVNLQEDTRLVTDLDDQKYFIPADQDLDKISRKLLAKWL